MDLVSPLGAWNYYSIDAGLDSLGAPALLGGRFAFANRAQLRAEHL